jgi:hypothetical protein
MGCNSSRAGKANEKAITLKKDAGSKAESKGIENFAGSQNKSVDSGKKTEQEKKENETNQSEFMKSSNDAGDEERAGEPNGFLLRNVSSRPNDERKVQEKKKTETMTAGKAVEDWLGGNYQRVKSKLVNKD